MLFFLSMSRAPKRHQTHRQRHRPTNLAHPTTSNLPSQLHHTLAKPADAAERHELAWTVVLTIILGSVLCATSLLSLVAVTFGEQCGCLLLLSGFSGLLLGVFELCLLVTFGVLKQTTLDFVRAHQADFGLTENGLETFQNLYVFLLWLLSGLVVAEILRFRLSGTYV